MTDVLAAATEVHITPPVGVELAGYGPRLGRYSRDVHDPLVAQALVLDNGDARVALITCDLIAVSAELTRQVRLDVARRASIPAQNVMIAASHSHTAPTAHRFRECGTPDRSYVRVVGRLLAGAVVTSAEKLEPALLSVGRAEHPDLAWNRAGKDLVDPTVEVVTVMAASGNPLAVLVHYACHPVMLGPIPVISADYPGALRRYLQTWVPGAVVMFMNGACGDIDPSSNRDSWGQATFDEVDRAGQALGEAALRAMGLASPVDNAAFVSRQCSLVLDYAPLSLAEIRDRIAAHETEAQASRPKARDFRSRVKAKLPRFWLRYYRALEQRLAAGQQPESIAIELQLLAVGGSLAFVGIPAEAYTEQGLSIKQSSPFEHTLVACYANGIYGYLPPQSEFEIGAYAARLAAAVYDHPPYKSDVADRLVNAVGGLLAEPV